jgi:hypothetical protein
MFKSTDINGDLLEEVTAVTRPGNIGLTDRDKQAKGTEGHTETYTLLSKYV